MEFCKSDDCPGKQQLYPLWILLFCVSESSSQNLNSRLIRVHFNRYSKSSTFSLSEDPLISMIYNSNNKIFQAYYTKKAVKKYIF